MAGRSVSWRRSFTDSPSWAIASACSRPPTQACRARRGSRFPAKSWLPASALIAYVPRDVEVVHAHYPIGRPPDGWPFLQTLHGNLRAGEQRAPNTVFLSRDHARRHGATCFVYNGLDPAGFQFQQQKEDYDLFIGRLHSAKGYRWAIEAAKRTGQRLVIAGSWRPSLRRKIRYVGTVDSDRKRALLAGARCLWMPALWDE